MQNIGIKMPKMPDILVLIIIPVWCPLLILLQFGRIAGQVILYASDYGADVYEGNYDGKIEITHTVSWGNLLNRKNLNGEKQTLLGFICLNASQQEPTYATLWTDKTSYEVDETVTFNCSSDGVTNTLWIYCPDGTSLYYENIGTTYQLGFGMSGHFQALIQTWNSVGSLCSEKINFFVGSMTDKPEQPAVAIVGNDVKVLWNKCNNAKGYDIYLIQEPYRWEDVKMSQTVDSSVSSCTFKNVVPGEYKAFVISRPNADNIQSMWTAFSVKKTSSVILNSYYADGKIKFNFIDENNGIYPLAIYKDDKRIDAFEVTGNTYEYKVTEPGKYKAYITSYKDYVYTDSNWVYGRLEI